MSERASSKTRDENVLHVLVRVDEQIDFMPGGSLAVPNGDEIVSVSNELARSGYYDLVVDTFDDHPADHGSFASQYPGSKPFSTRELNGINQVLWPDHCVHGTRGAEFHPDLDRSIVDHTVAKGQDKRVDSYSGFYENGRDASAELRAKHDFLGQSTGLADYIREQAESRTKQRIQVDVIGLALGYCVSLTAKDARSENYNGEPFQVRVIEDAVRAIISPEYGYDEQIRELKELGIEVIQSSEVLH